VLTIAVCMHSAGIPLALMNAVVSKDSKGMGCHVGTWTNVKLTFTAATSMHFARMKSAPIIARAVMDFKVMGGRALISMSAIFRQTIVV